MCWNFEPTTGDPTREAEWLTQLFRKRYERINEWSTIIKYNLEMYLDEKTTKSQRSKKSENRKSYADGDFSLKYLLESKREKYDLEWSQYKCYQVKDEINAQKKYEEIARGSFQIELPVSIVENTVDGKLIKESQKSWKISDTKRRLTENDKLQEEYFRYVLKQDVLKNKTPFMMPEGYINIEYELIDRTTITVYCQIPEPKDIFPLKKFEYDPRGKIIVAMSLDFDEANDYRLWMIQKILLRVAQVIFKSDYSKCIKEIIILGGYYKMGSFDNMNMINMYFHDLNIIKEAASVFTKEWLLSKTTYVDETLMPNKKHIIKKRL